MGQETRETEIRALIEDWAKALQNQDLEAVIAHHTSDMLMFDVPPPNEPRGVDAYRAQGAVSSASKGYCASSFPAASLRAFAASTTLSK